jgi:spore germination protein GerM
VGNCPEDMMTLKVYYTGCPGRVTKEYERQVPKTTEVAKTALQELFYGPYGQEKEAGQEYIFEGPNYIILKDIKIIDNIAYVNLNDIRSLFSYDGFYTGLGGDSKRNCEEFSFFEQATKTLKQFPNIKDAVYFIEGDMSLFYAFLGINCPDGLCQNNPFQPTMDTVFIFNNECNDPVREYQRLIPKDSDRIKATLNELFKGPSKHEIQPGRYAMFNQWTANILKDIVIKNKIAYVNLADFRNWVTYPDWKCNFPQFFASVGATLTQFPGINDAIYFINGNQDTFYNYMNIKCPYEKECLYNPFK